jgi:tripartite-type tricarboxylate transporter receptor subunit TctC
VIWLGEKARAALRTRWPLGPSRNGKESTIIDRHRNWTTAAIAAGTLLALVGPAAAQDKIPYPVDVVTLVTHSSPGGGSDVFLRDMSRFLSNIIDAQFVVENISGGSGANAMAHMAQAPADGRWQRAVCHHAHLYLHVVDERSGRELRKPRTRGERVL